MKLVLGEWRYKEAYWTTGACKIELQMQVSSALVLGTMLPRELSVTLTRDAVQQCPSGSACSIHYSCHFTWDAVQGYSLPYTSCILLQHGSERKIFLKISGIVVDICHSAVARLLIMHRMCQKPKLIGVVRRFRERDVPRFVQ